MKTKHWILLFAALFCLCAALTAVIFQPQAASAQAEIYLDGALVRTVNLSKSETFTLDTERGCNTITVRDGSLAVTDADCPDGYCVRQGWRDSGPDLICLPHHLVIRFSTPTETDAIAGQR